MVCLLSIVIDLDSLVQSFKNNELRKDNVKWDANHFVSTLILFCHSYLLMERGNQLAILTYDQSNVNFVYPNVSDVNTFETLNFVSLLPDISSKITNSFQDIFKNYSNQRDSNNINKSKLAGVLSSSLSIINRMKNKIDNIDCRILNIQFNKDSPQNYNSIMNSIFCAQKMGVMIDSFVVSKSDSHLMQQACFLTGGIYLKQGDVYEDVLLKLQTYFIHDNIARKSILLPQQEYVDFKASCHCHKTPVEFAYMCSVCLTLLCSLPTEAKCPVCETPVNNRLIA